MGPRLRALSLALIAVALSTAAGTAAVTGGDQVKGVEVYLQPADSSNGDAYATINDDDELEVEILALNPESQTVVDDLFIVGVDDIAENETASVWLDEESDVTFYRMDTREPIEGETNSIALDESEQVAVGLLIEAGEPGELLENITVNVEVTEDLDSEETSTSTPEPSVSPDVSLTDASLVTSEVEAGEPITATAVVANDGDGGTVFTVYLTVDNVVVAVEYVDIDAGETKLVTLSHVVDDPGEYDVRIGLESVGTATVHEAPETPTPGTPDIPETPEPGTETPPPTDATETPETSSPAETPSEAEPTTPESSFLGAPSIGVSIALTSFVLFVLTAALAVRRGRQG